MHIPAVFFFFFYFINKKILKENKTIYLEFVYKSGKYFNYYPVGENKKKKKI